MGLRIGCLLMSGLALTGCDVRVRGESAVTGALSPMFTAVGPIPGPATHAPSPGNPYRDDRAELAEGRQLFVRFNCSGCHGGRAGGGMGPSLRDVIWRDGNSDAQIFSTIMEGRERAMPAWGAKSPKTRYGSS